MRNDVYRANLGGVGDQIPGRKGHPDFRWTLKPNNRPRIINDEITTMLLTRSNVANGAFADMRLGAWQCLLCATSRRSKENRSTARPKETSGREIRIDSRGIQALGQFRSIVIPARTECLDSSGVHPDLRTGCFVGLCGAAAFFATATCGTFRTF